MHIDSYTVDGFLELERQLREVLNGEPKEKRTWNIIPIRETIGYSKDRHYIQPYHQHNLDKSAALPVAVNMLRVTLKQTIPGPSRNVLLVENGGLSGCNFRN